MLETPSSITPPAVVRESAVPVDEPHVPLRLTVTRGTLGLELYEPLSFGPLDVTELSWTLPGLRFPVDLSGGVARFRQRRGELQRLELSLDPWQLGDFLSAKPVPPFEQAGLAISVWLRPNTIGIGLVGEGAALAFDLISAPDEGALRLLVSNARGAGLRGPALGYALRLVDGWAGDVARREGRALVIEAVGRRVCRALLPSIGARIPAAAVRAADLEVRNGKAVLALDSSFAPAELTPEAARSLDLADLVRKADDALAAGDPELARREYLSVLERAPRHPELSGLVAEIDACAGGRTEAALGMIFETMPLSRAGFFVLDLLFETGDTAAARDLVYDVARQETFGPLAALGLKRLSELSGSVNDRLRALDAAVVRAPQLPSVRWARFEARLDQKSVEGALGDAEHLEAAARGARARHDVCYRVGRALLSSGFGPESGRWFERALRYAPEDERATVGLARAFVASGRHQRAVSLLERAVSLAGRKGATDGDVLLELAKLLAEVLHDLPQAVARLSQVPLSSSHASEARFREADYRARLGDIAGASLAYARFRDSLELAAEPPLAEVRWLVKAARFERETRKDLVAAERHLAVALRLLPKDSAIGAAYRAVAGELAERLQREPG